MVGIKVDRINVLGTLVGVFFIAIAVQGLTLAGVSDWVQYVLSRDPRRGRSDQLHH